MDKEAEKKILRLIGNYQDSYMPNPERLLEDIEAVFCRQGYSKPEGEQGAYNRGFKQGKFEERERILSMLKKEYPAIDTWPCWQALRGTNERG